MKIHLNNRKGFTLIELLVVISIIGLLSSVVLASVNTARDRGRVAAAITFAKHSNTKLYDDTKLFLSFDDPADRLKDLSWNNNVPTQSGTVNYDSSTYNSKGSALLLSRTLTGYINVPTSQSIDNIQTQGTISLWFKSSSILLQHLLYFSGPSSNSLTFLNAANSYLYVNQTGTGGQVSVGNVFGDNKWHNVVLVFASTKPVQLYLDGKLVSTSPNVTSFSGGTGNSLIIGAGLGGVNTFIGSIDDVGLYSSALLSSDIQRIYAEGLKTHTLAENK